VKVIVPGLAIMQKCWIARPGTVTRQEFEVRGVRFSGENRAGKAYDFSCAIISFAALGGVQNLCKSGLT
jgi:hypothetical protein